MDLDLLFLVANHVPLPGWLLLVFAPRWKWTRWIVHSALVPLLLGTAYALLLFTDMGRGGEGHFFSLEGVMAIFDRPQTVLAAWIHYLVFDLFVGAWEVRDAQRLGIRHVYVVPCLVLTLMFGPVGLLCWMGLRLVLRRAWALDGAAPGVPSAAS